MPCACNSSAEYRRCIVYEFVILEDHACLGFNKLEQKLKLQVKLTQAVPSGFSWQNTFYEVLPPVDVRSRLACSDYLQAFESTIEILRARTLLLTFASKKY